MSLMLVMAVVLLAAAACQDLTSTSPSVSPASETTLPATDLETTLQSSSQSAATGADTTIPGSTASESTTAGAETTTDGRPPDVYLDEDDFSREVRLQVGERVRVDLPAKTSEKVVAVEWTYESVIVEQIDSGTEKVNGYVTECWLELEALAAGNVTVRTIYERENGTTRTLWVVYIAIAD